MENWGRLSHLFVTVFLSNVAVYMVNPAITDVVVAAVCYGKDECSLAIYLTGLQQAISGLGAVIMMPLIGNLSDVYGRKALLAIPLTLAPIPFAILAWDRTTNFFYAYYAFRTITAMVAEGGVICLALGYLADNVSEGKRVSAFGVLSGVISAATFCGTLAARLLSPARIFQTAAVIAIVAAIYMIVFLKEKSGETNLLDQPILTTETESSEAGCESTKKINFINQIPSPKDIIYLFKSSSSFSLVACISFFNSLAEDGVVAFLLYYLKARFHFKKDQFADVLLITYVSSTVSTMLFVPLLGPLIGEETLLSVGLFGGFVHLFIDSIAWSEWVPYASASFAFFFSVITPTLRSMVSKSTGSNEQGIAQGCILGIMSLANLVSPLIYSPLSAIFFSENAPFSFPGFSILCLGFAYLIGFILIIVVKIIPLYSRGKSRSKDSMEALAVNLVC